MSFFGNLLNKIKQQGQIVNQDFIQPNVNFVKKEIPRARDLFNPSFRVNAQSSRNVIQQNQPTVGQKLGNMGFNKYFLPAFGQNAKQIGAGALEFGPEALNFAARTNPMVQSYQHITGKNPITNYTQSLVNMNKSIAPPTNRTQGNFRAVGQNLPYFALPGSVGEGLVNRAVTPLGKLAAGGLSRDIEFGGFAGANAIGEGKSYKQAAKEALISGAVGAGANIFLSPKLLFGSKEGSGVIRQLTGNASEVWKNQGILHDAQVKIRQIADMTNHKDINNLLKTNPITEKLANYRADSNSLIRRLAQENNQYKVADIVNQALKPTVPNVNVYSPNVDVTPGTSGGFARNPFAKEPTGAGNVIPQETLVTPHAAQVYQELDTAIAGKRFSTENGTVVQKSSFPNWIPSDLRKTPLLQSVKEAMLNGTRPSGKAGELYNITKFEIQNRDPLAFMNKENPVGINQQTPERTPVVGGEVRPSKAELPTTTPPKTEITPQFPSTPSTPQVLNKNVSLSATLPQKEDPVNMVINALKEAKPLSKEQQALYSAERSKRLGKVVGIGKNTSGEQGYFQKLGALKGELPKVNFEPVRLKLTQSSVDSLYSQINNANIGEFEKINAASGLTKLLTKEGSSMPNPSELKLMNEVFGSDFTKAILDKRSTWQKFLSGTQQVLNLPRAMMASFDLSAPLRQGVFLVGRPKEWVPAFISMFKQAGSEKGFNAVQNEIAARPTYKLMRDSKLALTDMGSLMGNREEAFMSNLGEKIPVLKYGMKASNRAYTGFLNKLRADTFDSLLTQSKNIGQDSPEMAHDIARFINSATGRGDLGSLNNAATAMNSVFFSPRLMAARINMLNPAYYASLNPMVRKEALKSLISFAAIAGTTLGLTKAGGANVGVDPRSADFGKLKVGNTRYDILGGFQQYIVLASRLLTGKMVSSTTGREISLTSGYKPTTRKDIAINFLQSKENPVLSFATSLAEGTDSLGQKFNVGPEIINRFIPMVAQDINDLYTNDKNFIKSVGMSLPGLFGVGLQTYGKQIPTIDQSQTGKPNVQWVNTPDIGTEIYNKLTGQQVSNIPESQQNILAQNRQQELQTQANIDNAKAKLIKNNNQGQIDVGNGQIAYWDDASGTAKVGTQQDADISQAKSEMEKSGKNFAQVGNTVLRKSAGGNITSMTRDAYDSQLYSAQLTSYKKNNNVNAWMQTADKQFTALQNQLRDPNVDELDKVDIQNKIDTLVADAQKYASYNGFVKPKSSSGKSAKKAKTASTAKKTAAITALKNFKVKEYAKPKIPTGRISGIKTITAAQLARGR